MSGDLISREKVLRCILESAEDIDWGQSEDGDAFKHYVGALYRTIAYKECFPSEEPERKWIPCSERLPLWSEHVDDMVLVCYGNGSIRFDTCMNGEWVHGNPIAWMPLPESYRGDR